MTPPAVILDARGLTVGVSDPLGPVVARFESWRRGAPVFCRHVGVVGTALAAVPALHASREGLWVAWCEEDGAWMCALDWEDGAATTPRLVLEGAAQIALAGDGGQATLFAADAEGIAAVDLRASDDGPEGAGPSRRLLTERRAGARLAAAVLRDERLLVWAFAGDEAWGTSCGRGERWTTVRHPLPGAVRDVRTSAGGGRVAVTIDAGEETRLAILGAGARVFERPHPFFPTGTPPLRSAAPVWVEDRWAVLAAAPDQTLRARLEAQPPFALPALGPSLTFRHRAKHLYAFADQPGALQLLRCDREGHAVQRRTLPLEPVDADTRGLRQRVRATLAAVVERGATGYRDASQIPSLDRDGAELTMGAHRRLRLEPHEGALRLSLVDRDGPAPSGWIGRALRAATRRWRPSARRADAEARAWTDELARALDATVTEYALTPGGLTLELSCPSLPEAADLARWWRRVREECSTRRRAA